MEALGNVRTYSFRVRYAETDQMGIAHHSNYFVWFEEGRSNYCRDLGLPYGEWEKNGVFLPVVEVHCRYKSSLLYDEPVTMEVFPCERGAATVTFAYRLRHADGRLAAEGWTKHAFADAQGRLIRRETDFIRRLKELTFSDELVSDNEK
ncbi:MAG: acyl-CoA thioesterase [Pyramidobacter sp.]|nr:acyl-CoA thioesterase [Pyramidobacter sp.]